jgi:hypothetical protein
MDSTGNYIAFRLSEKLDCEMVRSGDGEKGRKGTKVI